MVKDDRSRLGTTYNYVLANWKTGFRTVSDAPPTVIAAIEKSLTSQAVAADRESIRSSYDDETGLCILSVQSPYSVDPDEPTEEGSPSFIHAIATNELQLDDLSTDNLLRLFESLYGCPLLLGIKQRQSEYSQIEFPEDRESALTIFLLRQHLAKCFPTQALSNALPLSSLLSFPRNTSGSNSNDPLVDNFTLRKESMATIEKHVSPFADGSNNSQVITPQISPTEPPQGSSGSQPSLTPRRLGVGLFQLTAAATLGSLLGASLLLGGLFFFSDQLPALLDRNMPPVSQQDTVSKDSQLEAVQKQAALLEDVIEGYEFRLKELREEVRQVTREEPSPSTTEELTANPTVGESVVQEAVITPETNQPQVVGEPNPPGMFEIQIRNSSFLRPVPSIEGNEPTRILQDKERYTVTAMVSQRDGTWYEIRRGWIKKNSRLVDVKAVSSTPDETGTLSRLQANYPGLFEVQIVRGVNLYSIPNSERIEGVQLLQDQEIHTVISEYEAADGIWYAIRYGWVKKTSRISIVKGTAGKSPSSSNPVRVPDF